jgi:hypothetical protein
MVLAVLLDLVNDSAFLVFALGMKRFFLAGMPTQRNIYFILPTSVDDMP